MGDNAILNRRLEILVKGVELSHGNSFQIIDSATEKAHASRFSLVLGTTGCCEVDDMRCLVMFDRCMRLTK